MHEHKALARAPRVVRVVVGLGFMVQLVGCSVPGRESGHDAYMPRTRDITVTTIPLLVKESEGTYPFLKDAFAKGGVLEGHEVYAFSPSTITAVENDTLRLTFVNPEDDLHTFVLPDFSVALPGQSITHATYVARRAGIYPIACNVPSHMPMMSGQLVILSSSAVRASRTEHGASRKTR